MCGRGECGRGRRGHTHGRWNHSWGARGGPTTSRVCLGNWLRDWHLRCTVPASLTPAQSAASPRARDVVRQEIVNVSAVVPRFEAGERAVGPGRPRSWPAVTTEVGLRWFGVPPRVTPSHPVSPSVPCAGRYLLVASPSPQLTVRGVFGTCVWACMGGCASFTRRPRAGCVCAAPRWLPVRCPTPLVTVWCGCTRGGGCGRRRARPCIPCRLLALLGNPARCLVVGCERPCRCPPAPLPAPTTCRSHTS